MNPILVTGATGTVGRELVPLLRQRGLPVRAFVRDPEAAKAVLGREVELAVGDFADRASVRTAMAGADQVFLACGNHPHQVEWETGAIDAAMAAGVRRVVKLSALGAEVGSPVAFLDAHGQITDYLAARQAPAVLLEPAFAMSNLLAAAASIQSAGAMFLPAENARIAMIDPRDTAEAAVAVLTAPDNRCGSYQLTGPAAVTFDAVAEELSRVLARPVGFVPVPDAEALGQLIGAGLPEWFATNVVEQFGRLRTGVQAETTDTFSRLTGLAPRSITSFLQDHVEAFDRLAVPG